MMRSVGSIQAVLLLWSLYIFTLLQGTSSIFTPPANLFFQLLHLAFADVAVAPKLGYIMYVLTDDL